MKKKFFGLIQALSVWILNNKTFCLKLLFFENVPDQNQIKNFEKCLDKLKWDEILHRRHSYRLFSKKNIWNLKLNIYWKLIKFSLSPSKNKINFFQRIRPISLSKTFKRGLSVLERTNKQCGSVWKKTPRASNSVGLLRCRKLSFG